MVCRIKAFVAVTAGSMPVWAQSLGPSASASSNVTAAASTSASAAAGSWNPSASTNPGTNPLIPNTLSSNCQAFLAKLNAAPEMYTCTNQLITATSAFASASNGSDQSTVNDALTQMCSDDMSACSMTLLYNVLTHFAGNCSAELRQGQSAVQTTYDALYIMNPFKQAICTKDSATGNFCYETIASAAHKASSSKKVKEQTSPESTLNDTAIANTTILLAHQPTQQRNAFSDLLSSAAAQLVVNAASTLSRRASVLLSRQSGNTTSTSQSSMVQPNSTTFLTTNLPFLFLQSTMPSSVLCTACTQDVLASYIAFEMTMPYVPGLNNSSLLAGQLQLWNGVSDRCGQGFTTAVQAKAGVDATFLTSGAWGNVVSGLLLVVVLMMGSSYMLVL